MANRTYYDERPEYIVSQAKAIKVSCHSRPDHNLIDMANEQRAELLEGKRSSGLLRGGKREGRGAERASLRAEATFPSSLRENRDRRSRRCLRRKRANSKERKGMVYDGLLSRGQTRRIIYMYAIREASSEGEG